MLFAIGDYLAGVPIGIVTALLVRIVVWPGMDMVIAMLLGTALGMAVHLVLGLILSPLLGMFETMVSASTNFDPKAAIRCPQDVSHPRP